jgi:type VI secretion system protein ImpC
MSQPWSLQLGKISLGTEAPAGPAREDTPFRILVVGDFTGRKDRGSAPTRGSLRPVAIDRDNYDEVLARLGVRLALPGGGEVRFAELDDFLPDRLLERAGLFTPLRDLRRRLRNPATFAKAAEEVRGWAAAPPPEPAPPPPVPRPADVSTESLLEQMLEAAPASRGEAHVPDPSGWQALLREIVAPYALPKADPEQGRLVALVDEALAAQLRALLHHPGFKILEAAWRGLFFLTRRLDTDNSLKIFLVDLSREELSADLAAADDLRATALYRLLVEDTVETPGGQPWAVVAGCYAFGPGPDDVRLLARLGQVAARGGAPFLAAADSRLVGSPSLAELSDAADWAAPGAEQAAAWDALRHLPEAEYLGLALPRYLLRLPYGKSSSPIEAFEFEELAGGAGHEDYLWGNPAVACAYLLGEAFSRRGWGMRPGEVQDIEGLPLHVREEGAEGDVMPCAEVVLRDRAADKILEKGLMPLLSFRGTDRVRLALFQSLADPSAPLRGRWR